MRNKFMRLLIASAMAAMAFVVAGSPRSLAAGNTSGFYLEFDYLGTQVGEFGAFGKLTSFSEPVRYKDLVWDFSYRFGCSALVPSTLNPEPRTEFACMDHSGHGIDGQYQLKYLNGASGSNCFSPIIQRPGSSWGVLARLQSKYSGGGLRITAGPPPNGPVLYAIDPCGYPPAVDWNGDITLDALTKQSLLDLFAEPHSSGCEDFSNKVSGHMSGWVGLANFKSELSVCATKGPKPPDSPNLLDSWNRLIEQWLQDRLNDVQLGLPPQPAPYLDPKFTGLYAGTVINEDPATITTFSQSLIAGTGTQLVATLNSAQLAQILKSASPPTLRISSTFTPEHGRTVKASSTYVPSLLPTIASVSFEGSPTDPTITVHGQHFGTLPKPDPPVLEGTNGCPPASGTYGSDFGTDLYLSDPTANWGAGQYNPGTEVDCIGVVPTSESPTEVTFQLGSFYANNPGMFSLTQGQVVQLGVDGASISVHVSYGSTVTS